MLGCQSNKVVVFNNSTIRNTFKLMILQRERETERGERETERDRERQRERENYILLWFDELTKM